MCETDGVMTGTRWRAAILSMLLAAAPFTGVLATGQQQGPPPVQADAIPANEVLNYQIEWRLIPAGTAKLTWAESNLKVHIESTGLVSRLYHVDDEYGAALTKNLCVQSSFLTAHEGSRNRDTRVNYDQQTKKAKYVEKDLIKNTTTVHEMDVPPCVHDVIGGLMVLRTLHLEPGNTAQIPISDGKKFVQVKVESQRREEISTATGTKKTIRYEVFLFDNVLFKRSGHLHVWLTDDNLRLPVQLQIRLQFTIGTITLKLDKEEKS
jgi:Protein of unknown function (DUF3108)